MHNDASTPFDPDAKIIDMNEWRRCYLMGEQVQRLRETDPAFRALHDAMRDDYLTKPEDRALFGLPPKPPQNTGA
jgi:hypothetical protein